MRAKPLCFLILAFLLSLSVSKTESMLPPVAEAQGVTQFYLPWAAGKKLYVIQGNNSRPTHHPGYAGGSFQHAWDFSQDENGTRDGEPILVVADGIVRVRKFDSGPSGWGNYVVIEHQGSPRYSLYAHLRDIDPGVKVNEAISRGCAVGTLGSTGGGAGGIAHLHFQFMNQLSLGGFTAPAVPGTFVEGSPEHHGWVYSQNRPCQSAVTPAGTSTVLVVDISGSMGNYWQGGLKIESAKSAATQIVNMMESESQVGGVSHEVAIATFSTDAYLDLPLTTNYDQVRSTISWLGPLDATNIGAGLTVANGELARADPQSSRFIILLSDGMTNEGLLPDEIISGPVREARDVGACIYTIGFGDQGDIDEDLLRRIARESACGEYYYATDSYRLESVYVEIRHRALGNIVGNFSGYVGQGETDPAGQVTVEPGQDQLAATLNWRGSRLDLIVADPTGRHVDEGYPGASIFIDARPVYFIIENPKPGVWEVAVAGIDVPEGMTDYNVILSTREGVIPPPTDNTGLILVVMVAMVGLVVGFVILTSRQPAAGVVVAGVEPARLVGFRRGLLTIGRGSRNSMPLSDPKVSRNHAQIRRTPQGYMIHDLNTTNGTFVNEEKITSQILRDGDEIRVGDIRLQFRSRR